MFGEHRHSGESPRFPSPWQQALSDPSINIKVSPIPSPFLTATTTNRASLDNANAAPAWIGADRGKTDPGRSDDETIAGDSLSSISDVEVSLHSSHDQLERSQRAPSTSSYTSTTPSLNLSSPPTPRTPPPRRSPHHPPHNHYPSGQSLILSPSRNGSTTKLVAERDKTGHIEYKLKLDAKVGGERFERLVTQLRWRLTEGGGEAMYELGILDDGTLIGIPRSLMELSLRTLELMAAELGATVMVLRVINLTCPPPIDGKLGVRIGEASGSVRRYRGRGGRGRGRGRGVGQRGPTSDGIEVGRDDEPDDDEEEDYRARVGNARAWTSRDGDGAEEPYVSSARRRRDLALRKEKARQSHMRRKDRQGGDALIDIGGGEDSTGISELDEEEKRMKGLSAKQRKQLTKRMIYDSVSPSEEEREIDRRMSSERDRGATDSRSLDHPISPPKRTLEVGGRVYGPDEDWPIIAPQPAKAPSLLDNIDPTTSIPASWKERNLAQYALASDADGRWKAKREYGKAEKEMIRRERRERKRDRKKMRELESAEGSGSRKVEGESMDKDEEDGWGMFEMDHMGNESGDAGPSMDLSHVDGSDEPIAPGGLFGQQVSEQHKTSSGSQESSSPPSTAPSPPPPVIAKQHRSKRKMRQSDPRRQQRKESRRLDLLRGDGTNWVNPYAHGPGVHVQKGDLEDFEFDLGSMCREDEGSGSASAMGGFGLGGGDSTDEDKIDVRGVVSRVVGQSGVMDERQEQEFNQDETDSGFLDILASPEAAYDNTYGTSSNNLAISPTKTIQALSPRPASVFALPPHQHTSTNDLIPSPTDTITLPMDNLSLSFSQAEVCAQEDALGGSSDESLAEHGRPEEEPRVCVEALVVKKIELEDRMYLDFSCLG